MIHPKEIPIAEYNYELPDERIAKHPMPKRDEAKLLVFKNGEIATRIFKELDELLEADCMVISNNTKVIPARLFFKKMTGGVVEIFCLEPLEASHQDAMTARKSCRWLCMVGGAKKWKGDELLELEFETAHGSIKVTAEKIKQDTEKFYIKFNWPEEYTFSEILENAGQLPLPPYFKREAEKSDYERYQTIFAQYKGSVAAPTAGLHFTPAVTDRLKARGITLEEITLHVGAGTFRPVSAATMSGHDMHSETFSIELELLKKIRNSDKKIIPVGTTTMRTLESLYWLGIIIHETKSISPENLKVQQWQPYETTAKLTKNESLDVLIAFAAQHELTKLVASTSIMIAPGYVFKMCTGLITNFHQPKSTLLLLVAAFTGYDSKGSLNWKKIYEYAMQNNFRFLSYGDSSLLLP
jgi:S-adenosylmethionine:tRNA ribosyltransferase-isomerase